MLDLTPEEFHRQYKEDLESSLPYALIIKQIVPQLSVENVIETISPFADNVMFGSYVEKMISDDGQQWLDSVINLLLGDE